MLVVDSIVPGSFAESLLEPGDIATKVEGRVVTHFLDLEDILDSSVGTSVTLHVERGGQPLQATVEVCFFRCLLCRSLPLKMHAVSCRMYTMQSLFSLCNSTLHQECSLLHFASCGQYSFCHWLLHCCLAVARQT